MARAPRRIRAVYDGLQSIQPLEPARPVAAHIRGTCCVWRSTGAPDDRQFSRQGASLSERGQKRGTQGQAIGRSRGGRTTKIHALVDEEGRPHAFLLTGGYIADCPSSDNLRQMAA